MGQTALNDWNGADDAAGDALTDVPLAGVADRPLRVLIVDDSGAEVELMEETLRTSCPTGVEVTSAATLKDGMRFLGSGRFDIAFIDFQCGEESGTELIRSAGGRLCATPMVLMSGAPGIDVEQEGLQAGAVDFLDKNELTPALLRRIIRYANFNHNTTRRLIVAEHRHRALAEDAHAASVEKTKFLAQVSHELRTPLNAILGFTEVLKNQLYGPIEGEGAEKYREYLSDIFESGRHLLSLINDLLDLSKIEAGRVDITPVQVHLSEVLGDVARMTQPQAAEKGVRLSLAPPSEGAAAIFADRRLLTQALLNIVANAIKFTPGGGTVSLSTRAEGNNLVIAVADTGCGIRPQDIRRVLEPFQQADTGGVTTETGTGLGLPLAKSIMELHRGGLEISSEYGEGTTVSVWLPRRVRSVEPLEGH